MHTINQLNNNLNQTSLVLAQEIIRKFDSIVAFSFVHKNILLLQLIISDEDR